MIGTPPRAVLGRAAASFLLMAGLLVPGVLAASGPDAGQGTGGEDGNPAGGNPADLSRPHAGGVVLVGFSDEASEGDKAAARSAAGAASARPISMLARGAERLELAPGASVERAIAALKANSRVRYAEPDYIVTRQVTSNDPYYTGGSLWGMYGDASPLQTNQYGSGAAEAWASGYTGSDSVVIGVIDEGIQDSHPDLSANIWTNPGEIAGNGIDDDSNGFIDDIHGWDFFGDNASTFDGGAGSNVDAHGTHVSGTIGGVGGNGIGVAGVNWQVKIISAKFLGPSGGAISDAVNALDYLVDLKVNHNVNLVASSNSWGGGGFSQTMLDAINRAGDAGMLFIAAAGNSNSNNDTTASYPSNYECTKGGTRGWDCVVAVAAIDSSGNRASFSSYGATTVDMGAPGVGVSSTVPLNSYASYSGTSMATPHVSGAAALCASINPALSAQQIRAALVGSAAATPSMSGSTVTGGRLDVGTMVGLCLPSTAAVTGGATGLSAAGISPSRISLSWTDGASNESAWEIQRSPAGCGSFVTIGTTLAGQTSFIAGGLSPQTTYCFQVRASNSFEGGSQTAWSTPANGSTLPLPPPYTCAAATYAWINATGSGGTSYALTDDSSVSVTIPFSILSYGEPVSSVQVSSNGYLRMGSGAATAYANVAIPNSGDPNGFAAAFWDDLNPGAGGSVWTRTVGNAPNRQFVAAWVGVPHYSVAGSNLTFEIVLDEGSGAITIQYQDAVAGNPAYDYGASATAGLENTSGSAGTQISYNAASLQNGTARRCTNTSSAIPPTITTTSFPDGTTDSLYGSTAAATGGQEPHTWSIIGGALPDGLSLNNLTGAITGTPTAVGTASFTLQVRGNDGAASSAALSIRVANPPSITSALAAGNVGAAYSAALAATGGQTPYTWSITIGLLPPGLNLNTSTGAITGTPTTAGTWPFTAQVTDSGSPVARVAARALSITVTGSLPAAFNKVSPKHNARLSTSTTATLTWGTNPGATSYEYCVSTSNGGACIGGSWISTALTTASLTGLTAKTTYWWQVRARNGSGTTLANAGTWWRFATR